MFGAIRRMGRVVRAGTWLGAGHRRSEQSEPARGHWLRGGHVGIQFWFEGRSRQRERRDRSSTG
jgi:hypothetical protein